MLAQYIRWFCVRPSVRLRSEFYRNGCTGQADFWHRVYLHCIIREFGYLQKSRYFLLVFPSNCEQPIFLSFFRHDTSIVASVVNLVRPMTIASLSYTERPPLFPTRWAWRVSSTTADTCCSSGRVDAVEQRAGRRLANSTTSEMKSNVLAAKTILFHFKRDVLNEIKMLWQLK